MENTKNFDFTGRKILVTGATSGIGQACVRHLVSSGAFVIGTGRDGLRCNELRAEIGDRGVYIQADVGDESSIARMMAEISARHGILDGIVISAGVAPQTDISALDRVAYDAVMDVNVMGAVFTFSRALPLLADGASVIFVGSVAGSKGQPGDALYAGSKGFISAFARNLGTAPDLMARSIRVNVVAPGPIETRLTAAATANPGVREYVEKLIPMRRWGQADEVANAIAFLLSPASSFTTGSEIAVDGGMAFV